MLLPDVLWYHISPSLKRPIKKNVNMLLKTTLYISVLPLTSFTSTSTVSQQPRSARRLKTTSKPLTLSKHDVLAGVPEIASWLWIGCIPVYVSTRVCLATCLLFFLVTPKMAEGLFSQPRYVWFKVSYVEHWVHSRSLPRGWKTRF